MADAKRRRRREYWAGLAAVLVTGLVVAFGWWPVPQEIDGPLLEVVVRDRAVLGVLRLSILVAGVYAIASVPALVVGGRWAKAVGTTGIVADDAGPDPVKELDRARSEVAALRSAARAFREERDSLWALIEGETAPD